jgi:hypothetical protein
VAWLWGAAGRKLLERWVLAYPAPPAAGSAEAGEQLGGQAAARPMSSRQEPAAIYKRMVITLRSLFSYVRMLPAYRLFRACTVRKGLPIYASLQQACGHVLHCFDVMAMCGEC